MPVRITTFNIRKLGIETFGKMTFGIMPLGKMTLSMKTPRTMITLSIAR